MTMLSKHATSSRKRRAASEFAHAATPCLRALLACVTVTNVVYKRIVGLLGLPGFIMQPIVLIGCIVISSWDYFGRFID